MKAPKRMLWDGCNGRPASIEVGDLLCFVMSASCFKPAAATHADVEMTVYVVTACLGPTHAADGSVLNGRPWWNDRRSGAIRLEVRGFISRERTPTHIEAVARQ